MEPMAARRVIARSAGNASLHPLEGTGKQGGLWVLYGGSPDRTGAVLRTSVGVEGAVQKIGGELDAVRLADHVPAQSTAPPCRPVLVQMWRR